MVPEVERPADGYSPQPRANAAVFVVMWAIFVLAQQVKLAPWHPAHDPWLTAVRIPLVASAFLTICLPRRHAPFASMLLLQLASVLIELPELSNCWLYAGFINIGILAVYARLVIQQRRTKFTLEDAYEAFSPMLRVSLIAMYSFAAIAKWNHDFINPATSCAAYFGRLFADSAPFIPSSDWLIAKTIPLTLFVETALPILFLAQSTRRVAIVMGMTFHTILAHNHNVSVFDFNAMLFALYVPFLPADFTQSLRHIDDAKWAFRVARHRAIVFGTLIAVSVVLALALREPDQVRMVFFRFRVAVAFVLSVSATILAARTLYGRHAPSAAIERAFLPVNLATLLVTTLVFANSAAPYLGLKTGVAMTMFSNLRTEAGFENHLFIPPWVRVFGYQDQSIRVVDSSSEELKEIAESNERLIVHDFRVRAWRHPDAWIVYELAGTLHRSDPIADDSLINPPPSLLERKLLHFRTIPLYNKPCQW
jgi:hypothetical protein